MRLSVVVAVIVLIMAVVIRIIVVLVVQLLVDEWLRYVFYYVVLRSFDLYHSI